MFKLLDGHKSGDPAQKETCPFSEGCKRHFSPGDILRYSVAIMLSVFGFLLTMSLFFPHIIQPPNLDILHRFAEILHYAISGAPVNRPSP